MLGYVILREQFGAVGSYSCVKRLNENKTMNKKILALGFVLMTSLSLSACTGAHSQSNSEVQNKGEEHKGKATKNIDAKFMRENIFDYKANPTQFVFKGTRPTIIDFYADWCGPCRQLSPRLEKLAQKYAGKVDVFKVNVDNETELAQVFGVRSIPMLLFIGTDGSMPSVSQGALDDKQLEAEVQRLLSLEKK